jgi:hypothetical protein
VFSLIAWLSPVRILPPITGDAEKFAISKSKIKVSNPGGAIGAAAEKDNLPLLLLLISDIFPELFLFMKLIGIIVDLL